MKRLSFSMLVVILALALLFAFTGCQQADDPVDDPDDPVDNGQDLAPDVPPDLMEQVRKESGELYIYDWAEWWPEEIFENFSEEFGIRIVRDHFASTEEMVTKFRLNPDLEYDLINPGTGTVAQLRAIDVVQHLNHDWLPNFTEYIIEDFFDHWFNPESRYGVLTDFSFTSVVYNSDFIDEDDPRIGSWALLFEADDFAGRITMLDQVNEPIGAALAYLGYEWSSIDEDELNEAKELLLETRDNVLTYDAWPSRLLIEEEALISQLYSGDAFYLASQQESLRSFIPKEGTDISPSVWSIPIGAKNPATAHLFLNYIFRPDVNQTLIEWIGYGPTHRVVAENLPQEMIDWPGLLWTDEVKELAVFTTEQTNFGEGRERRLAIYQELRN